MSVPSPDEAMAIASLRSPATIRARCEAILAAGLAGELAHFTVALDRIPAVVELVVAELRRSAPGITSPSGGIPWHGRLAQLRAGGIDRVAQLDARLAALPTDEQARAWVDLVVVSVVLDAFAGSTWRYREPATTQLLAGAEGLAVASLDAFVAGAFSSDPKHPLRADAAGLRAIDAAKLATLLQIDARNPIVALDGRVALLRALGDALDDSPHIFPGARPGGLVEALAGTPESHLRAEDEQTWPHRLVPSIEATSIFHAVIDGLESIWPARHTIADANLGDVWPHPRAGGTGLGKGLVPLHLRAQWLVFSLFEPLERAGYTIAQASALAPIADHRNGGLLVDLGVLVPTYLEIAELQHDIGDECVVEWRALTVALIERVAHGVRTALRLSVSELPLGRILGATDAAGLAVATERRPGGVPPIPVRSDGTIL